MFTYIILLINMDSLVVSIRLKKELKHTLESEGIDIEKAMKDYLTQRAAQIELKKTVSKLRALISKNVKPSKKGFAVNSIREDRNAH
jgi:hypothetical protein